MTPRVAIIGAGPAGLLAAYAAREAGAEVTIYTDKLRDGFPGAQALQCEIPGLTPTFADAFIHVAKWGSESRYRAKVYGEDSDQETSWTHYGGAVRCWDMSATYQLLQGRLADAIIVKYISAIYLRVLVNYFDAVINTAPVPMFCVRPHVHRFTGVDVQIAEGAQAGVHHNQIIYNGTERDQWYRSSQLFGHGSTEWPGDTPFSYGRVVRKPISTNCDCWINLPNYYRAGRFGRWEKGILVHDGYEVGREVGHALLSV